jgi:hypothetical protein
MRMSYAAGPVSDGRYIRFSLLQRRSALESMRDRPLLSPGSESLFVDSANADGESRG